MRGRGAEHRRVATATATATSRRTARQVEDAFMWTAEIRQSV